MRRTGWNTAAVAIGLFAAATRADDIVWTAVPALAAPVPAAQPPKPNTEGSWRPTPAASIRAVPVVEPSADAVWRSSVPQVIASDSTFIAPEIVESRENPPVVHESRESAASPLALAEGPDVIPVLSNTMTTPAPLLNVVRPSPSEVLPTPASLAAGRANAESVTLIADSANVWGSYGPRPNAAPCLPGDVVSLSPEAQIIGGAPVPKRHGTYGMAEVRLSRDYHFLDALFRPFGTNDEKRILADADRDPNRTRYFFQAEYLLWWVRNGSVPVLASTATAPNFGELGQPTTRTLLGPGPLGDTLRNGVRVRAGAWLDDCNSCGIDGSFFGLGRKTTAARLDSAQYPVLSRPFFSPNINQEFAEIVAYPGRSTGRLEVAQTSTLWGADLNVRKALCAPSCDRSLEVFAGYRHVNLHEDLTVSEFITAQNPTNNPLLDPTGTTVVVRDRFDVRNQFHGGQLGLAASTTLGRFVVEARGSVALGATHQTLDISGSQVRQRPGQAAEPARGGLLAAGPNLGRFTNNEFSVVPEATFNLGYYIAPHWKLYGGYNILAWTNVVRPGDAIDRVIDVSFVPNTPPPPLAFTTNRPLPTFRQSDLWVQGVQFGLEGRW